MSTEEPALHADELRVQFPARAGYLYISRLNAAAIATEAGFNVDAVEDLRLATTEVVRWLLLDAEGDGHVELHLTAAEGEVQICGSRSHSGTLPDRQPDALVSAVLGSTVDSYQVISTGTDREIELRKSAHS